MFRNGLSRLAGIVITMSFAVAGCASGGGASGGGGAVVMATPEMEVQGQQMFNTYCARCHGAGGVNGRFGPSLADDTWLWVDPDSDTVLTDIAEIIRTGVTSEMGPRAPGSTGMPAMAGQSFDQDQLNALAAYILSLDAM